MKWQHSNRSEEDYNNAPARIQRAFDKQARLLADNLLHPSLHAKKFDESEDVWQARVTKAWRFYFKIESDRPQVADENEAADAAKATRGCRSADMQTTDSPCRENHPEYN